MSGPAGLWQSSLRAAALLAAAQINARGGVGGQIVEIAAQDCGRTATSAVAAVETLIGCEDVDVILGAHPSDIRDAVSARVNGRAGYVYTSQYEGVALGPAAVAIGSTDSELMGPALSWFMEAQRVERFFFVGDNYVWPRMACESARRWVGRFGGRWRGEAFLPAGGDPSHLLRQIANSGAQLVVTALVGQSAIDFNRAFAAAGLDQKMLRFGLLVDETVICGIGAEASLNLFTAAHYFAACRARRNDVFLEGYHDAFGEYAPPVSATSARYHQGLHFVAEIARECVGVRSPDFARRFSRSATQRARRGLVAEGFSGGSNGVCVAAAQGVRLEVVAEFAA
jgi:ABC-type branched-subunit amino acid transport system substrate-binding protein